MSHIEINHITHFVVAIHVTSKLNVGNDNAKFYLHKINWIRQFFVLVTLLFSHDFVIFNKTIVIEKLQIFFEKYNILLFFSSGNVKIFDLKKIFTDFCIFHRRNHADITWAERNILQVFRLKYLRNKKTDNKMTLKCGLSKVKPVYITNA